MMNNIKTILFALLYLNFIPIIINACLILWHLSKYDQISSQNVKLGPTRPLKIRINDYRNSLNHYKLSSLYLKRLAISACVSGVIGIAISVIIIVNEVLIL